MADYDIIEAFREIENELISSMIRNLDHHRARETAEGIQWTQWQTEQLNAFEQYKKHNQKKFGKQFQSINNNINSIIREHYSDGQTKQERKILQAIKRGYKINGTNKPAFTGKAQTDGEFFGINSRKLESLITATTHDMQRAETAVLRLANDNYRKAIFNAQIYAQTGGTYEKAVDMATRDMLKAGLNCIEYKNGARHTLSSYSEMALRTSGTRAYLQGEGSKREEWGIHTVILNQRSCPCPLCLPFIGKVFVDDVWSGGTAEESQKTGYPLLSEAMAEGLYHPNCKDIHTTYFEGITTKNKPTADEKKQLIKEHNIQQKANYSKNQVEKYERISKYSLDTDNKYIYKTRAEQWREKTEYYDINSNIDKNNSNGIIEKNKIVNPDVNINSVPNIKINGLTDEQNLNIKSACEQLLTQIQGLPKNTEIAYCLDYETMKIVSSSEGIAGNSSVSLKGINKPFATIHNHPSNSAIDVSDIMVFLRRKNEVITAVIGNKGKFSAIIADSENADRLGYMSHILKLQLSNNIIDNRSFYEFYKDPKKLIKNLSNDKKIIAQKNFLDFEKKVIMEAEEYGYKYIEI